MLSPLCSESCDIFNIWRHYSSAYSPGQKVSISLNGIKVLRHTPKHASHKGTGASVSCTLGMCALVKHFGYPVSSQLVSMSLCFALCAEFASLWDATSLVINWILVTPLSPLPRVRLQEIAVLHCILLYSGMHSDQCSVFLTALCIPSHPPVIWIDKAQCTNFEYQTILSAYYQIHNSIMILSCVFFPSRGLKQIVSFVSTPRMSRPPLGEGEEEVDSKVGKNLGWPKSGPSEFVEGKKSSLAGDIATTLPRRIASRYQRTFFLRSWKLQCSSHSRAYAVDVFIQL